MWASMAKVENDSQYEEKCIKEDGSVWIDLTDEGLDEKIVLRSDIFSPCFSMANT